MKLLNDFVGTPLAAALARTLAHFLWEGALLAAAAAATLYAFPHRSRLRYAVAAVTLFVMPVAFGVTLARLLPETLSPAAAHRYIVFPASPGENHGGPARDTPDRLPWIVPLWTAGVIFFYGRALAGWRGAQRLRRVGVCAAAQPWQERLDRLARRVAVSRPVLLLDSCLAEVPAVIGLVRPVILMPVGLLAGLGTEQVEAILIHELAHIRRGDYLVNLAQRAVEGLLFYHPAVWWISSVIRTEREHCCDDEVIALTGDASGYAAALVTLEGRRSLAGEAALAANGGSLMKRIRRLLETPEGPRAAGPLLSLLLLVVPAGLMFAAWQEPPPPPAQQAGAISPYEKWLAEDVAYIINDEERAAFTRLQTSEELEHFIEQFWLRRDPTPGTAANEFKQEHYRRIAYANDRFGTAARPGWKTDRGLIYIIFGPPDEIESHPASRPPQHAWRYRHNEAGDEIILTFSDFDGSGYYPMARYQAVNATPHWRAFFDGILQRVQR